MGTNYEVVGIYEIWEQKSRPPLVQEAALCYHIHKPVSWAVQEQVLGLPELQLCNPFLFACQS